MLSYLAIIDFTSCLCKAYMCAKLVEILFMWRYVITNASFVLRLEQEDH